jgi:hypothetical protein
VDDEHPEIVAADDRLEGRDRNDGVVLVLPAVAEVWVFFCITR